MEICFITIFPEMMTGPLTSGMLDIAVKKGIADYTVVDLRDFAVDKHGSVDDYPYGGGPGMVMMAPPVVEAVESVRTAEEAGEVPVILMSPVGRRFDQSIAIELARHEKIVFVCGRYKGIDARVEELVITDPGDPPVGKPREDRRVEDGVGTVQDETAAARPAGRQRERSGKAVII